MILDSDGSTCHTVQALIDTDDTGYITIQFHNFNFVDIFCGLKSTFLMSFQAQNVSVNFSLAEQSNSD